jgi:uncharacterized protein YacL (UPF0231 family)
MCDGTQGYDLHTCSRCTATEKHNFISAFSTPVLELNGTTLSWNTIEHATGYVVSINDTGFHNVIALTFELSYLTAVGAYNVKVKATGAVVNYADVNCWSNVEIYTIGAPLETPQNLQFNNKTGELTWDPVGGTNDYVVLINGQEVNVATNSLNLSTFITTPKLYTIKVIAKTNDAHNFDSDPSDALIIDYFEPQTTTSKQAMPAVCKKSKSSRVAP